MKEMNNADLGITIQKFICNYFDVKIPIEAENQFKANFNNDYVSEYNLENVIKCVFNDLGVEPKDCVTYTLSKDGYKKYVPYNFILMNLKTLSIRTSKTRR